MHSLGQCFVGARNLLGVTLDGIISDDFKSLIRDKLNWLVVSQHTSSDLRSLSIEHDGNLLIWSLLEGLSQVVNTLTMRFVISM